MYKYLKKRYIIPVLASGMLFIGVSFKDDFFEVAKQIEIFTTLFKAVNSNYVDKVNPGDLMDKAIKSMLAELDPYTNYFNEQDVVKFKINNTGEYTGIGAVITRKEAKLIVKEIYKNYPADKAGLKGGDEIISIGDINLADYKEDASQLLRGGKNAKVDIKFIRQGKTLTAHLILEEVEVKAVPYFGKIDDKTGYIVLNQFTAKASMQVKEALEQLKREGAEKIVSYIENKLGIKDGETTADGIFTLKTVECLGACGYAPMLQAGEKFHEHLTEAKVDELIEQYRKNPVANYLGLENHGA